MIELYLEGESILKEEELEDLKRALYGAFALEGLEGPGELSISFVDSDEIRELNHAYRGKDEATDVLSFPQEESLEALKKQSYQVLGDIVINMDRVRQQADEFGHSLRRELVYLSLHSFYHLLGYDHEEEEEKKHMRIKEEEAYQYFLKQGGEDEN